MEAQELEKLAILIMILSSPAGRSDRERLKGGSVSSPKKNPQDVLGMQIVGVDEIDFRSKGFSTKQRALHPSRNFFLPDC